MKMTLARLHRSESYHITGGNIGEKQAAVLLTIARNKSGLSNSDIAASMSTSINRVTGRTFELRELGLVVEAGSKVDLSTGRTVTLWKIADDFVDFLKERRT